ncbi:MAG: hypothetical protein EP320_11090 [Rhodobacteraceae bacterium]|nr:MAG: hypothetical protein EP320_11090 [Paracoccaceae bacterium]
MNSDEFTELRAIIEAKALAHRVAMSFIVQTLEELTNTEVSPVVANALRQIREGNLTMVADDSPLSKGTDEELDHLIDMFSVG